MTHVRPFRRAAATLAAVLSLAMLPSRGAAAVGVARYDLPVGRVLSYSTESKATNADGTPGSDARSTMRATVVAANADGSRRVIFRLAFIYTDNPEHVTLGAADVFPDGRTRPVGRPHPGKRPEMIFPMLPPDGASEKWESPADWTGSVVTYAPIPASSSSSRDEYVFSAERSGPIDRIYVLREKATVRFDRRKGIVVGGTQEHSAGYFNETSTGKLTLDKDETIDPARAAAIGAAYGKLFDAEEKYIALLTRMNEEPANGPRIVEEAKATLATPAKDVREPEVSKEFERLIKQHDQYSKFSLDEAKRVADRLNKPAHQWTAKDLDGKSWSQSGLKGKVVVMDFWYRGCGWCIYAMPQVKQLAADYKDKGVVVLGMNTDSDLDDARFVVKELGLDYPQIQAGELPAHFGVRSFPSLLVIDQEGVVRLFHSGYSPDLREKLGKHIDELLRKNPA